MIRPDIASEVYACTLNPFNQPIVEYLQLLYNDLSSLGIRAPYAALGAMGAVLLLFVLQLRYYLHVYGRLPRFRNNRGVGSQVATPPISVVIVVRENSFYFIEQILPKLLRQQYDAFEVILVDCSYNEEISELLALQRLEHPNLHVTAFKQQLPSAHSTKLALTVGIKAARYEHILFTTPDAVPDSDRWIALMAKGFICGDVVLGYCGIELKKSWSNRWIRCSRLALSMRYLAAAVNGHPYRGITHNIGYTKTLYFEHHGFNHLNMNIGEDDLFIQKIVSAENVSVVMHPHATVRQFQYGGVQWWYSLCKYLGHAYRHYPSRARRNLCVELVVRTLFVAAVATTAALLPLLWIWIPLLFWVLREVIVLLKIRKIGLRLGEKKFVGTYLLYDLWAPVGALCLSVARRIFPNRNIWR